MISSASWPGHLSQSPHNLYCGHCGMSKRLFLSTTIEEENSFLSHHAECKPHTPVTSTPPDYSWRDWNSLTQGGKFKPG